jgi:alanine racemase
MIRAVRLKIWVEIAGERLNENFGVLQQAANGQLEGDPVPGQPSATAQSEAKTAVLAVVKANAYGHGIVPCAAILARAGAEWLGVTDAHEGAAVREALLKDGIPLDEQPRVLVMCGTAALPGEAELMVRHGLTATVWAPAQLQALADAACEAGNEANPLAPLPVHLEIDTGMARQGVAPGNALAELLSSLQNMPELAMDGIFTHFASTEVAHSPQTASQREEFELAMAQIAGAGLKPRWVHVGNSSFLDNRFSESVSGEAGSSDSLVWLRSLAASAGARPMLRSGIALYGYVLPIDGGGTPRVAGCVKPVMTWKTRVIDVRDVPAGTFVGYNGIYRAEQPTRLALLPVGYADGLRRELSSSNEQPGGWMIIRGARAAIVGRVSMNLTTVDVTGIADAAEGDEAVLLGEGVSADNHARLAGTIAYEILCGVRTSP